MYQLYTITLFIQPISHNMHHGRLSNDASQQSTVITLQQHYCTTCINIYHIMQHKSSSNF